MDTSVLAAIIGGLAAVLGGGMAVIAILASRSMKAAQTDQAQEAGDQAASPTELSNDASDDDPNAFVDPFASDKTGDQDDSLEWGSAFDDPDVNPDEQWGFDADDGAKTGEPDPKKPRPDSNEGT